MSEPNASIVFSFDGDDDRSGTRRLVRVNASRARLVPALALSLLALGRSASGQRAVLAGTVVDKLARVPLPYSGISIVGRSDERLTSDSGAFRVDVDPGVVRLHVRHVGFTPVDTQFTVSEHDTTHLTIELSRIPVTLAAMHVTDEPCRLPGAPTGGGDALPQVFEQLQLNAEQFRLVSTRYAFNSVVERQFSSLIEERRDSSKGAARVVLDTIDAVTKTDSITIPSNRQRRYRPGEVIVVADASPLGLRYAVQIPNLAVFADPEFVKHHCFRDGGDVELAGQHYRRIDFRAAEDIRDPDIDGTMYLDPETFVIRRSRIRLSRKSDPTASFDSVSVETVFEELVTGVPVITRTSGRNSLTAEASRERRPSRLPAGSRLVADLEVQRIREIRFTGDAPGAADPGRGDRQRPPKAIRVASSGHRRVVGVFDATTGDPLPGAVVRDSASGRSAVTDSTGIVRLTFVPRSSAVIQIDHTGFERESMPASLTLVDGTPITVVLRRTRGPVPPPGP